MSVDRLASALADRYRIERELGAGGMATVYLARDLRHDRDVAIKVLKPELAAVLGAERFVVEIKTTASLQHPHILPLFDSGTADGFLFYVMPYVQGETIRQKLNRETQFGVDEALRIAREIADALDYAHRHGVIHRDIKPENILLHDGRAMVMDFGIALAVSAAAGGRMTETGLSLGTPHYMSPEQATAEKDITPKSDIYSLASVVYEMLAGQPPHIGGAAQQVIMKIITETAQPVTSLRKSAPEHVSAALAKALEKLPADRFESAAKFAEALANPGYGSGLSARAQSPPDRALRLRGRRTTMVVALAAALAGIVGTKLLWRGASESPRATRVMLEFPASEQPTLPFASPFPMLAQTHDGRGLLYWGRGAAAGPQLFLRSWDHLSAARLPVSTEDGCCVVVSPAGDSLAYLAGAHALHVAAINGGVPRTIADSGIVAVSDFGGGVDWGSDGWLYVSGTSGIMRVRSSGGAVERVTALDSVRGDLRHMWPVVLPGAQGALFTLIPSRQSLDPAAATIGVVSFATGKVEILGQGLRAVYAPTGHVVVVKANGSLWAAPFDVSTLRLTGRERALPDTASAAGGAIDLSLSSAGTLAYTKTLAQSYEVVLTDRNGVTQSLAPDLASEFVSDPTLSPDGRRLAVAMGGPDGNSYIWIKPLAGGTKSRLTFDVSCRPSWRPSTGTISYGCNGGPSTSQLSMHEADGSGQPRPFRAYDPRPIGGHAWSPDGKWLILRTDNQAAGNGDILAVRPDIDTIARPLVATAAEELAPAVSPDGRWIAYSSNMSGRREIWVRPFPETATTQYQVSLTGGMSPVWSRDSHELFYLDGALNMVSVPIIPGPRFERGAGQVLFSVANYLLNPFFHQYDVTPDGKRFVMIRAQGVASVHVIVVFNFLEELKRVMADAKP